MNKLSVADINFSGRKVLLRVDFNVPLDGTRITDDRRIREALPTIKKILGDGGRVIACSHLGRPGGKPVPEMSLKPVAARLAELLGHNVLFADDCVGAPAESAVAKLKDGDCLLLENLRFHKQEEKNDPEFAKQLASLADIYVNDAFGSAHRAHASTEGVTKYLKQSVGGFLMQKELRYLDNALNNPKRPFVSILGGAKISGKIDVIQQLMGKVDALIIGGGMAFTFAKAMGYEIGKSLLEPDKVDLAREIMTKAKNSKMKLLLPVDVVVAPDITETAPSKVVAMDKIPADLEGLDIGPASVKLFSDEIANAKTILWNGPMGLFETKQFAKGTFAIAKLLADLTARGAITIVGGGDSAAAVSQAGLEDKLTHISTGGGASLEFLEGKVLPGVAALTDKAAVGAK